MKVVCIGIPKLEKTNEYLIIRIYYGELFQDNMLQDKSCSREKTHSERDAKSMFRVFFYVNNKKQEHRNKKITFSTSTGVQNRNTTTRELKTQKKTLKKLLFFFSLLLPSFPETEATSNLWLNTSGERGKREREKSDLNKFAIAR